MNKKIALYSLTAVILGFAVMMLPLAIETGPPTYTPQPQFPGALRTSGDSMTAEDGGAQSFSQGLFSQPSNLLPTSLVLMSGVIAALGMYIMVHKRMG